MRHVVEFLESRFLLSGFVGPNHERPIVEPGHRPFYLPTEAEPNDSLDQANEIELTRGFPCYEYCALGGQANNAGHVVRDRDALPDAGQPHNFPLPGDFDRRQHGFMSGSLSSETGDDGDFFTFSTDHAGKIFLSMTGSLLADGFLPQLLDASGALLATAEGHDENEDGSPDFANLDYFSPSGGQFYVQVGPGQDSNGDAAADYFLNVRVAAEPNFEIEPNNSLDQANPIELHSRFYCEEICIMNGVPARNADEPPANEDKPGFRPDIWPGPDGERLHGVMNGVLEVGDSGSDVDFFSIETTAERKIVVHVEGDAVATGMLPQLLDADGSVLATAEPHDRDGDGNPDGASLDYYSQAGGQFLIQVGPAGDTTSGEPSGYHLRVEVFPEPFVEHEPNDSIDTANPIQLRGRFDHPCNFVCPLHVTAREGGIPDNGNYASGEPAFPLPIEYRDEEHGFVRGQISPELADTDFFSFEVGEKREIYALLAGPLAPNGGSLVLLDVDGNELARGEATSAGVVLELETELGGTFYLQVSQSEPAIEAIVTETPNCPIDDPAGGVVAKFDCPHDQPTAYVLRVSTEPIENPIEGPDEQEPNNSLDEANPLEIHDLETYAPGVELRGGDARGVAGGADHDEDFFGFELYAGEHVTVGAHGFFRPAEFVARRADRGPHPDNSGRDPQHGPPDFLFGAVQVVVYDPAGNEVGRSSGDPAEPHAVVFDAAVDGEYYAAISVPDSDELVQYRLGVLAKNSDTTPDEEPDEPVDEPLEVEIGPGDSYDYTDSDGDDIHIVYQGKSGSVTITFDDSDANGSDIESIVIKGVRKGGNFIVDTAGDAEIGSLEIYGTGARSRRAASFGRVAIDGNLGSFTSDLNLRTLAVDGILGDLTAHGRQIGQVRAVVFDQAMADVGSIRTLHVDEEVHVALFERFLPWEDPV